jgi:lactate 2-monooxygenase
MATDPCRKICEWTAEAAALAPLSKERASCVPLSRLERKARTKLPRKTYDYISGGAGGEDTIRANLQAFSRWQIVPRVLRNVSKRDLSITLLGSRLPAPVLLAPIGLQDLIHPDAEIGSARAAASLGIPFVLSTVSSHSLEAVAAAANRTPKWFQLYCSNDIELTEHMLERVQRSGYNAIVVTVDTPFIGWRERQLSNGTLTQRMSGLANYLTDPVFRKRFPADLEVSKRAAIREWQKMFCHPHLTWDDLSFVRRCTRLPLILKGILRRDDATRALDFGVDGLIVSNHGGRQVDGAIGSLNALPDVIDAVNGKIPILFDGGIRRGADAFKALALGAAAVLLGRLYLWGLAVGGEQGVRSVLLNFLTDLDLTFALSGYSSVSQLGVSALKAA